MLNPIRIRIIQLISKNGNITATQISEKLSDVPRTTLYRHIKILLDSNLLTVVSEKKIRGSLERTLAINVGEYQKHNTIENAAQNALGFFMGKYAQFEEYFSGENPDPGKDLIFMNNTVLMMDDSEFNNFLTEMRDLIIKYDFEVTDKRRARDISIISSPSKEN